MGIAVGQVLRVSEWVSEFGGSTLMVPAFGAGALGLMALALVILTLLISPLRLVAVVPAAAGLWLAASPKRVDIYIDRDGSGVPVRGSSDQLVIMGRAPAFVVEQWLKADGDARKPDDPSLKSGPRCDPLGCVAELQDVQTIALINDRRAFPEDCRRATFVVTRLSAPSTCRPPVLLDRAFFAAHGATAIRLSSAGHEIVTTRRPDETRPWLQRAGPDQASRSRAPNRAGTNSASEPVPDEEERPQPLQ
jgi:competence protein ComEC